MIRVMTWLLYTRGKALIPFAGACSGLSETDCVWWHRAKPTFSSCSGCSNYSNRMSTLRKWIKYSEFISLRLISTLPSNLHFDQPKLCHVTSHGKRQYVQTVKFSLCSSINQFFLHCFLIFHHEEVQTVGRQPRCVIHLSYVT